MSPFTKQGEREVWSGAVISVAEGTFVSPSGTAFRRDLVHHPGAVSVVPAHRELAEEVGLAAGRLVKLAEFYNSIGFSDELSHVFLGTDLTPVPNDLQGEEEQHLTIERIRLDDVPALIAARELVDAKTVIGLLLAREHLG